MIVFRLNEGTDDINRVCKIITHLTDGVYYGSNIVKPLRLGKKSDNVVRPILIKFDDVKVKELIFKNIVKMRPGSVQITVLFFKELVSVLEHITLLKANILLMGDFIFIVHIEIINDENTIRLFEIFDVFQLVNHINESTQSGGGTLDLVVSSADFPIISTTVFPHGVFSDHSLITIKAIIAKPRRTTAKRFVRSWKKIDKDRFVEAVLNSPLSGSCRSNDVDSEIKIFNDELKNIIDRLVPKRVIFDRGERVAPWFDEDCLRAKRCCRTILQKMFNGYK
ncbi:hypothetical protein HELRODRAFT_184429 [Helobdella robusta]|uniref:Endonuclease/exonuclease/phosphatase domain-containing protein n=1 Tax=Helobdella robusta TaxID=6412 RepID=T1FL68_HELRO|nr:hypothetical protein HELRODRAFT_184429 [Helobdella robusta]ESN97297.1 hypothetical protein HELRODRAFT_184429 [Helobdella robusta]